VSSYNARNERKALILQAYFDSGLLPTWLLAQPMRGWFGRLFSGMAFTATLFSQIMRPVFAAEFSRFVKQFPNRKPPRGLTEYDHFLAMCFGQLTYRESLRDIVACLNSKSGLLYHLGFRGRITRTNLAYANQHRDWRLFQALAQTLMRRAAALYADDPKDP
jgi:hypothetical protein